MVYFSIIMVVYFSIIIYSSNPRMQHFVIGVEQGLSADSIYHLGREKYNK